MRQTSPVSPAELRQLVAQAARAVAGVAFVAESDVRIQTHGDSVVVDCTLTAYSSVQLHELGVAVQMAVAALLREIVGLHAHEVHVLIDDIDDRAAPRPDDSPGSLGKKFDHG